MDRRDLVGGYAGKILAIDLSTGEIELLSMNEEDQDGFQ